MLRAQVERDARAWSVAREVAVPLDRATGNLIRSLILIFPLAIRIRTHGRELSLSRLNRTPHERILTPIRKNRADVDRRIRTRLHRLEIDEKQLVSHLLRLAVT